MSTFDAVIDRILAAEGGYVNNPADRGGPTNYGITQARARSYGWTGDMRNLPVAFARSIYLEVYITAPRFDRVHAISEPIGMELIDTGVNMGPAIPALMFQRWLNAFNLRGKTYPDLVLDGRIGPASLDALRSLIAFRGRAATERVMVAALNASQAERYREIAERDDTQEGFMWGWITGRVLQDGAG